MHKTLSAAILAVLFTTPALAERNVSGTTTDSYKQIIDRTPYNIEVCTDVTVSGDKTGDMLRGAIIGGIIGNNVTKNLPDGGKAGAIIGGLFGHSSSNATGGTQRRCNTETRYKETYKEVYSHSNLKFILDGKTYNVRFRLRNKS